MFIVENQGNSIFTVKVRRPINITSYFKAFSISISISINKLQVRRQYACKRLYLGLLRWELY